MDKPEMRRRQISRQRFFLKLLERAKKELTQDAKMQLRSLLLWSFFK
jgi:hypothetical protein